MKLQQRLPAFLIIAIVSYCTLVNAQSLPTIQFAELSTYRTIDKTGQTLGKKLMSLVDPDIGCGNTIFSESPLPYNHENEYNKVSREFDLTTLTQLQARAYHPGIMKDLIAIIVVKNPDYRFAKKYSKLELYTVGQPEPFTSYVIDVLDNESLAWDQNRYDLIPDNFFSGINIRNVVQEHPGKVHVYLSTYLRFYTNNPADTSVNTLNIGDHRPYRDILISYGFCVLNYPTDLAQ